MTGFAEAAKEWFSSENRSRRQVWLKDQRDTVREKGLKQLGKRAWQWIVRIIKWTILALLVIWAFGSVIEDNAAAFLLTLPVVALIAARRWWAPADRLAAGVLVLYGLIGLGAFALNWFGFDTHIAVLYGVVLLGSFFGILLIDSQLALALVLPVAVAVLAVLVIKIVGGIVGALPGVDFPTALITNLIWIVFGIAAVVMGFLFARSKASAWLVFTLVAAAGFHQFVWGYEGFRRQDIDAWGIATVIPDQAFYGVLLLIMAAAVFADSRSMSGVSEDGSEAETEELSASAAYILDKLYEVDKTTRVFAQNGLRFLSRALSRAGLTQEDLDEADVTIEMYGNYAAQRAVDEIRAAHNASPTVIIRKDGTVHPSKLSALGFREDFLEDHEITSEELLTGELTQVE